MKKKIITVVSLLIVAVMIMSHSAGITNRTAAPGETTCATSGCHTSFALNSGGGTITINSNIPATGYAPGQTYSVSVVVSRNTNPLFGFDFEALTSSNVTAGNITVTDALSTYTATGNSRQNITHKSNGGLATSSKTFAFNWTAPASNVGNITFYATGLAANKNNNATGDYVYSTSLVIPPADLVTGTINGSPFCAGTTGINIPYTVSGTFNAGNVFTAQLSNATGAFSSPLTIGSVTATTSGTIISNVPLPSVAGTGYRIRIVASSPTSTGTTNNSNLTINLPPTAANAGGNQSVCGSTTTLAGNLPSSGSGIWSVVSGSASITAPLLSNSGVTALASGTNVLQWTISSPGCSSSTSTVSIYSATPPTIANASIDQTVCTTYAVLNGNTPTSGTGTWSLVSGAGTIAFPSNPTTTVTNLGTGVNVFAWTISNSPCASSTDNVNITKGGSISVAAAGPDQTVCATTANLAANTATSGTGSWSVISGAGVFSNSLSPTSAVTALGIGANVFRWTISNGACTPTFDDVSITSVSVSPANAGLSQTLCATATTLSANNPVYGTGLWTVAAGGATLSSPSSALTNVSGLTAGINKFVWTISNAPCSPSSSTVTITQSGSITNANAGLDQAVCSTSATLAGNVASVGSGSWSVVSGTGQFANAASATSAVTSLGAGNNVFRWTITNGGCTPSIDDVTITSSSVSAANAGPNQNVCVNIATLNAVAPAYGAGTWSLVMGSGSIVSVASPSTLVTGLGNGVNIFRWTVANAPCPPSVSDVTVTNCASSVLYANSITGSPFCSSTSYNVLVSFSTTASFTGFYTAELSDASGSFASPVTIGSGASSPISAVIPSGTPAGNGYRIRVTNSNPYLAGGDNGSNLSVNTCTTSGIAIGAVNGSPFCANTSYSVSVSFTTSGTFSGAFIAQLSDSSGSFAAPLTLGYGYSSPVNATIPAGTTPGVNYRIRIMNNNTSIASSSNNSNLKINTCTIGFEEFALETGVLIYPNPTNGEFYVMFEKGAEDITIGLTDILGRQVLKEHYAQLKAGSGAVLTITDQDAGVYILTVRSPNGEMVRRLMKN